MKCIPDNHVYTESVAVDLDGPPIYCQCGKQSLRLTDDGLQIVTDHLAGNDD